MATGSAKRIQKELQLIAAGAPKEYRVRVKDGTDNRKWEVTLLGPKGSCYEGGKFLVAVDIPQEYPFKPPLFTFATKIYHPSIKIDDGSICGEIFSDWKPSIQISDVINDLLELLRNPDARSPMEPEVAKLLEEDRAKFLATAREWTKKYAH
eukprot:EG_transcript_34142